MFAVRELLKALGAGRLQDQKYVIQVGGGVEEVGCGRRGKEAAELQDLNAGVPSSCEREEQDVAWQGEVQEGEPGSR